MLHVFISRIGQHTITQSSGKVPFLLLLILAHSTSVSTSPTLSSFSSSSSSHQFELMSDSSYRNFILRQYFIDLLNISHSSLVRSMIFDHHQITRSISSTKKQSLEHWNRFLFAGDLSRRKRSTDDASLSSPMFTLQSTDCAMIANQVRSTFRWSHTIESLTSIELIYHMDSMESKPLVQPLRLTFRNFETNAELFTIDLQLPFDVNRDFYSVDIRTYFPQTNNERFIIQSIITGETCQSSQTYLIVSSLTTQSQPNQTKKLNPTLSFDLQQLIQRRTETSPSSASSCQRQTIQIQFEELGLAYLIIRPKEYLFTYCDGSCSSSSLLHQPASMHALLQSIIKKKNPTLPQPTCVPSQFADDHFLLRQNDGSIELYPIKDIIVKQCACL